MSGIACLVVTDGRRDCIERTIASVEEMTTGIDPEMKFIYDDSASPMHYDFLCRNYLHLGYKISFSMNGRQGFAGAVRAGWSRLRASEADYIFMTEDDFVFKRPVPIADMIEVLDENPHLVQLVVRRQAWSPGEIAAGGVIEMHPDDYEQIEDARGRQWIEHTKFFSTNPYVARRSLLDHDWPTGAQSEGRFSIALRESDPKLRFAFWGHRSDEPWCEHIGETRRGRGY